MYDYSKVKAYQIFEPEFIDHLMAQELQDVADNAEEMHMRTAARTLLAYFTVQDAT